MNRILLTYAYSPLKLNVFTQINGVVNTINQLTLIKPFPITALFITGSLENTLTVPLIQVFPIYLLLPGSNIAPYWQNPPEQIQPILEL